MKPSSVLLTSAMLLSAGLSQPALSQNTSPQTNQNTTAQLKTELKRVKAKHVCMVNDHYFERDQIPIEVSGKTYYGCCDMCQERLQKDTAIREARDPVNGQKVDKATAIIAAKPDGSVLYFASEDTFKKGNAQ